MARFLKEARFFLPNCGFVALNASDCRLKRKPVSTMYFALVMSLFNQNGYF
jgi:hypothetical protein